LIPQGIIKSKKETNMKQQNPRSEEKFMSHNAWFSVFIGVALLAQSLYPLVDEYRAITIGLLVVAFIGTFIMFCLQGGLKSRQLYITYKDEFLSAINTKAYKHCAYSLIGAFGIAIIFGSTLFPHISHSSMAFIYLAIACVTYGISLLWQSRA
jgi:hypothetical protein